MKKLLHLFLLGVAAMFFSCESYDDNEGKLNLPEVSFETAQKNLPFREQVTVKIVLDKPAEKELTIPFTLLGNAMENRDFEFIGLPDGITAEERHLVTVLQGSNEATLTLKHRQVNANPVQTQINLSRSPDDSYQLGNNKQMLVKLEERETVYLNFTQPLYEVREFSNMTVDFTLTGEQTGDQYRAPEDFNLQLRVVPIAANVYDQQITNIPESAWQFEGGSSVTIEQDSCSGTKNMRIRYIHTNIPSAVPDNPVFPRGEDWPEGYNYRFGLTFNSLPDGFALGDICDTTYVYVRRIQDPYEEILMGKRWINPKLWVDINDVIGNAESGKNLLQSIYNRVGENDTEEQKQARWNKLPREANFNDGFIVTKTVGTGPELVPGEGPIDEYFIEILHELPVTLKAPPYITHNSTDSINRPGFEKAYRDGLTRFNKYENMNMRYNPLGSGAPGIQFRACGNVRFSWKESNLKHVKHDEVPEQTGISMYIIPSSSYGDKNETFIDVFFLGGNWEKGDANNFDKFKNTSFMHNIYWYEDPDRLPDKVYPYRDNRLYDIWYRFYRDTRETAPPVN